MRLAIILTATLAMTGCVNDDQLRASTEQVRQAAQADHASQEQAIAALKSQVEAQQTRLDGQAEQGAQRHEALVQRIEALVQRLDGQLARLEQADAGLSARLALASKSIDELAATVSKVDREARERTEAAAAALRKDQAQAVDQLAAQVKTDIEGVRSACAALLRDLRQVAGGLRSSAHRSRDALAEQYQGAQSLVEALDRLLADQAQATAVERADAAFAEAGALHRTALAAKDADGLAKAAQLYRTGLELDPVRTGAHYNLASLLLTLDLPGEAIPHLERVLALQADGPLAPAARQALDAARKAAPAGETRP